MKYQTAQSEPRCTVGWPKTAVGYPYCDTVQQSETITHAAPNIYEYCCPPMPVELNEISGIKPRANYRQNVPKPRGVHSYYNLMWDGRVRRGDPNQRHEKKEEEECEKIRQRLNQPRVSKPFEKRPGPERKKSSASEADAIQKEVVRYTQLAIANLAPKDPGKYLVDLGEEIDILDPCYKGKRLQPLRQFPVAPARKHNLEDCGTQVFPTEFYNFDVDVQPVLERLLGTVLEESQLELLVEEEKQAEEDQRQNFENALQETRNTIEKWRQREINVEKEKQRLRDEQRKRNLCEEEACKLFNICNFTGGFTKEAIADCMDGLKQDGFLRSQNEVDLDQGFMPWLNEIVVEEIQFQNESRSFLDELIMDVVNTREAEFAETIWREVYEEDPFKKYEDSVVPPPTPGTSLNEDTSDEEANLSDIN